MLVREQPGLQQSRRAQLFQLVHGSTVTYGEFVSSTKSPCSKSAAKARDQSVGALWVACLNLPIYRCTREHSQSTTCTRLSSCAKYYQFPLAWACSVAARWPGCCFGVLNSGLWARGCMAVTIGGCEVLPWIPASVVRAKCGQSVQTDEREPPSCCVIESFAEYVRIELQSCCTLVIPFGTLGHFKVSSRSTRYTHFRILPNILSGQGHERSSVICDGINCSDAVAIACPGSACFHH